MAVTFLQDGQYVELDERIWSFDDTVTPWSPTSYVDATLFTPLWVWKHQRSVRTVVEFLARNVAQVALKAYTWDNDGNRSNLPEDRTLSRLLRKPSPTTTPYSFWETVVIDVCLWDRYAAVITGDGRTLSLERLPPARWRWKRDGLDRPTGIIYWDENGKVTEFDDLSELFWLDGYPYPGAENPSPITALCDLLVEERESGLYRKQLWKSGGRFPGWIERPLEAPRWSKTARTNFKVGWRGFSSEGDNVGQTPLLEEGMKYHELQNLITPETAQQLETRKFSIAETAAAFHLPAVFVGILDNANYANVSAFREVLYADTLGPWFAELQQAYDARVLPHPKVFGTTNVFVEFDVAEKLRMSFEEQIKVLRTAVGVPFMVPDEARRRINLSTLGGSAAELAVPKNVGFGDDGESPTGTPDRETEEGNP